MTNRNNGSTTGRNADGTFSSGNPGRPAGARHKVTRAVEELLGGEAEQLTRKAIDMALEGDSVALRLCMERIAPARKDTPVEFSLPPMACATDAAIAAEAILKAVSEGSLSPMEAASVMALVETYRKTLETVELEARLAKLEEQLCK
ncbi:DUF5681 domain-containing protein [Pseudooceanicola sp. MF1-13]|uniref:DUF5681 domain-containing protein n=1 Tax=Pseudooceanicola sp. MF1-13 TaxID=3379095 RepID=UPI003891556E